uniref:peptidylprolyl isomerase n=2 Tax=Neobodo designis TaxID=312471 RepID=A0A7S1L8M2_NEODS|mmetsp:Transcript_17026/g.52868  ORF Transcript_17026/g.52868 Transcript_17026/m.52868 type:complete len:368 (+) Transcript_17026:41-1144(+)|eukprot:CAMPEP_0174829904 /NCGR_PEP_ID=MMETSP1114-20130205/2219_1 /TAXON_ID=312471 /ORGANISM="Neobodo designis, Strain CCAP 1951/1" /LENGTH=367 /DNA_ID=CAMNT_0016063681 /DNA_START=41 /DNA_END=1144 /DNA_ORIENTATION=-
MSGDSATSKAGPRYCYMDLRIGDRPLERVIFELFVDKVPLTCANFSTLCIGEKAEGGARKVPGTETPMTYAGSTFHRVIPDFMVQGGDFTNHNGTGGVSIYGAQFDDEAFDFKCDAPGLLAMANRGPNTNGSQFFITCAPCPHLDGKHVVFGRVVRGMNSVRHVEHTPTGDQDRPRQTVRVVDCGALEALPELVPPADGDVDADYPQDAHPPLSDADKMVAAERVRLLGNKAFSSGDYLLAVDKYEKALRYLAAAIPTSAIAPTIKEKQLACHNNAAQCFLKLERFPDARAAASRALDIDPSNAKARFRRGVALAGMHDYEEAAADLKACLDADPANAEVAARLQAVQEAQAARRKKLAAGYSKMFS